MGGAPEAYGSRRVCVCVSVCVCVYAGADLGFKEGGVVVEIDARAKRAQENFG